RCLSDVAVQIEVEAAIPSGHHVDPPCLLGLSIDANEDWERFPPARFDGVRAGSTYEDIGIDTSNPYDGLERLRCHVIDLHGDSRSVEAQDMRAVKATFCVSKGLTTWQQIDKANTEQYGNWLAGEEYADRTIYLELTLVKSVIGWLISEGHLPEARRI